MIKNMNNVGAIHRSKALRRAEPDTGRKFTVPAIIAASLAINVLLFMALPIITKLDGRGGTGSETSDGIMYYRIPSRLPKPEIRDIEDPVKPPPPPKSIKPDIGKPAIDPRRFDLGLDTNAVGTLSIPLYTDRPQAPRLSGKETFDLSEVDRQPRLVKHLSPLYPFEAKRKNIQGKVVIKAIVNKDGRVVEPIVLESQPKGIFEAAALRAVKRWRFRPATKSGNSVDVYVVLPILFELSS